MAFHATNGSQMIRHVAFALVMGCVGAATSIVLCLCVDGTLSIFMAHNWLAAILPVTGLASLALYRLFKLDLDLTTHKVVHYMRVNEHISPLVAPGILIGTCLSVLGGASVGKEAGALQMGASLGNFVAKPFKLDKVLTFEKDRPLDDYTAAVGMAATFSALFFSPLGGTFLVLELCRYRVTISRHFLTIVLASLVGAAIAKPIGIGDALPGIAFPGFSWPLVGKSLIVGVCCALVGFAYGYAIDWLQRHTIALKRNYWLWVAVGGCIIASIMLGFNLGEYGGAGSNLLHLAFKGEQPDWCFVIKSILIVLALGFWFRGGEIMPTLVTGSLVGAACCAMTGPDDGFSAALGVLAFFTAVIRAPLASFFMGCEFFGWEMCVYIAIAVAVAYSIGGDMGIYGMGVSSSLARVGSHLQQRLGKLPGGSIVTQAPPTFDTVEKRPNLADRDLQDHPIEELEEMERVYKHAALEADDAKIQEALSQAGPFERWVYKVHEAIGAVGDALEEGGTQDPTDRLPGTKG